MMLKLLKGRHMTLEIMEHNRKYLKDESIESKLQAFFNDTSTIVKDFTKFINLSDRFPIAGKIEAFKKMYVQEFYYPALNATVGNKVNWSPLENFTKDPNFEKAGILSNATNGATALQAHNFYAAKMQVS